jgi:hypothetical protein
VSLRISWPELDGLALGGLGLGKLPLPAEGVAEIHVCTGEIRLELDGLAAGRFCLRRLPLVTQGSAQIEGLGCLRRGPHCSRQDARG